MVDRTKFNPMSKLVGVPIAIIVPLCFMALGGLIGTWFGGWDIGTACFVASFGPYFLWNFGIIKPMHWQTVERFGKYYNVKTSGYHLYCARGLIDRIRLMGTFADQKADLFCESGVPSGREEIDFTDGSAPIFAEMWYHVGRDGGSRKELKQDVVAYTYATGNPDEAVISIAEDHLRPQLQSRSIDEAQRDRKALAKDAEPRVDEDVVQYGIYLRERTPLLVEDIAIPESIKKLREESLRGKKVAEETANEAVGYREAIKKIMEIEGCTFDEARGIWERQQTRNMFAKTGSNISVVAADAGGVLKTFEVKH